MTSIYWATQFILNKEFLPGGWLTQWRPGRLRSSCTWCPLTSRTQRWWRWRGVLGRLCRACGPPGLCICERDKSKHKHWGEPQWKGETDSLCWPVPRKQQGTKQSHGKWGRIVWLIAVLWKLGELQRWLMTMTMSASATALDIWLYMQQQNWQISKIWCKLLKLNQSSNHKKVFFYLNE